MRPTGNCRPAFSERLMGFFLSPVSPLAPLAPLPESPLAPLPDIANGVQEKEIALLARKPESENNPRNNHIYTHCHAIGHTGSGRTGARALLALACGLRIPGCQHAATRLYRPCSYKVRPHERRQHGARQQRSRHPAPPRLRATPPPPLS